MKIFIGLLGTTLALPPPRIIGGKNAKDGDFPWQVTLKRASNGSHYCGGSILAAKKVILKTLQRR